MSWFDDPRAATSSAAPREPFVARLRAAIERWPAPEPGARVTIAFSGGVDSTTLLAAFARLRDRLRVPLRAAHVDHGLHADSRLWGAHCERVAAELGVPFVGVRVAVARDGGTGLEAAARDARYAALAELMTAGEVLVTAHHGDDQLETILLRMLRGTGVRGLRGIREHAAFGRGWLARPLLHCTRAELRAQAEAWGLAGLEDPANADPSYDRSFLRHDVVPALVARWPTAARSAQRLAEQMADAEAILEQVAERDAAGIADPTRVPRATLAALDSARQRNLLRHLLRRAGLEPPSALKIEELRAALLDSRPGAQPHVRWPGAEGRVYRSHLYLMANLAAASVPDYAARVDARRGWAGPEGELAFEPVASGPGLPESWLDEGLELRFRAGGEAFRPLDRPRGAPLKRWLHEAAIVPWMRSRIPLLFRADTLVAVADLWLSEDTRASPDRRWRITWSHHPPLR